MTPNAPIPAERPSRQVVLPLSKAFEIAWKGIRLRFGRSVLVTSGIALAMAFLMSILASHAVVDSLRQWSTDYPRSPAYQRLQQQRQDIERSSLAESSNTLRAALAEASHRAEGPPVEAKALFGDTLLHWQQRLGQTLPSSQPDILHLLSVKPDAVKLVRAWLDDARRVHAIELQLLAPAELMEQMHNAGVPSSAEDIRNNRLQTRWLVGLALLVAFVGILNAMVMSVTERFREIGTMKCLGALDGFIVKLFLIESLLQGIVGTIIGVLAGLALSLATSSSTYGGRAWTLLPINVILWRALFCMAVGIILTVTGALYPARQAAHMQPIEAMRTDT